MDARAQVGYLRAAGHSSAWFRSLALAVRPVLEAWMIERSTNSRAAHRAERATESDAVTMESIFSIAVPFRSKRL